MDLDFTIFMGMHLELLMIFLDMAFSMLSMIPYILHSFVFLVLGFDLSLPLAGVSARSRLLCDIVSPCLSNPKWVRRKMYMW